MIQHTPAASMTRIDIRQFEAAMARLDKRMRNKIARRAVSMAATPLARTVRQMAPVGEGLTPLGLARPHLQQTITKATRTGTRNRDVHFALVGSRSRSAPHGHLVHWGTGPLSIGPRTARYVGTREFTLPHVIRGGKRKGRKIFVLKIPVAKLPFVPPTARNGFLFIRGTDAKPVRVRIGPTRPNPFLQRAANASRGESLSVMTNVLRSELNNIGRGS